ncbi:hypothetical protein AB6D20_026120 [Vibrio splendidus]
MDNKQKASEKKYKKDFGIYPLDIDKLEAAFYQVADTRKFEIEMYWKRATYFWALIAVTFAGYFSVLASTGIPHNKFLSMILAGIGLIFTFGWHRANRGSKYWQENWENHMDLLEDALTGPLYKTLLERPYEKMPFIEKHFTGPKSTSVSKINQWISICVLGVWSLLIIFSAYTSYAGYDNTSKWWVALSHIVVALLTLVGLNLIRGKSDTHKNKHTPNRRDRKVYINETLEPDSDIESADSRKKLYSWYEYLNEIISVLCFTAAITALQFGKHSAEIASISVIFILILGNSLSSQRQIYNHDQSVSSEQGGRALFFVGLSKTPSFWLGMGCLIAVALGANLTMLEGFSFKAYIFG